MADEKQFAARLQELAKDPRLNEGQRLNATAWADLSTQDKLERLRDIVKELQHSSEWHGRRLEDVTSHLAALDEHGHLDGKVVIPVVGAHRQGGIGMAGQDKKVEGWF